MPDTCPIGLGASGSRSRHERLAITAPTTTNPLHQIPMPDGATSVDDWTDLDTDTPFRYFEGARRTINRPHHDTDVEVYISGAQHHDGSVTRDINSRSRAGHRCRSNETMCARRRKEDITWLV